MKEIINHKGNLKERTDINWHIHDRGRMSRHNLEAGINFAFSKIEKHKNSITLSEKRVEKYKKYICMLEKYIDWAKNELQKI